MRQRRDPRGERAAAAIPGSSRPRFAFGQAPLPRRPRRDPRAERDAQRVTSGDRCRLDLAQKIAIAVAPIQPPTKLAEPTPGPIIIEAPAFLVAVVPDAPGGRLTPHDRQLFGAARTLAGKDGAVVLFAGAECEAAGAAGADRLLTLPNADGYDPEGRAAAVSAALQALSPRHVLFPETPEGGDLARRVSLLTNEPLFVDVEAVAVTSLVRAARGRRIEQRSAPTRLISLAPDAAAPYSGAPREARAIEAPAVVPESSAILDARHIAADPASVPLGLADFVTSAGNGVHDLDMFRRLVAALGATPGASRVLCDAGLMPRESQVGASGSVLAATCYFALGIAGAPQHLQGVANCEHVIAVNTDLHAAMIERAGLAIVQDAQRVMPALLAALSREAEATR